jgi:glycosyltransferase involved in cell wall biosynthesis
LALTVLSVAYPFAAVSPDAVGGAEQVLAQLDRALVGSGHRSIVVACEGSRVTGTLVTVPCTPGLLVESAIGAARQRHRDAIAATLRRFPIDLVHMHGVDFDTYLPPPGPPVLATLHLPISFYAPATLCPTRPHTWLNCVSRTQHAACPPTPSLLAPIANGVPVRSFFLRCAKRGFALLLARICPEKGVHVAIDASKRAGIPLLIGGEVFPYADHQLYFETEVRPRLDRWRRYIGPVGFARKRRLLAAARCLIISSLVPETSSLVAGEALAAGTAVVAFATGALTETVEHGLTGFLVNDESEMAAAILAAGKIKASACRAAARERFSLDRMFNEYLATYLALARSRRPLFAASGRS